MAQELQNSGYILGLDVGEKRIGTAIASTIARLPQPLDVIPAGPAAAQQIADLIEAEDVNLVIVGIPRNLAGEETAQSTAIRTFAAELAGKVDAEVLFADESLSSVRAEDLAKDNTFKNVSSDSLAACFILEEYFATNIDVDGGATQL